MAQRRIAEGWQFIAVASELAYMQNTARQVAESLTGISAESGAARY